MLKVETRVTSLTITLTSCLFPTKISFQLSSPCWKHLWESIPIQLHETQQFKTERPKLQNRMQSSDSAHVVYNKVVLHTNDKRQAPTARRLLEVSHLYSWKTATPFEYMHSNSIQMKPPNMFMFAGVSLSSMFILNLGEVIRKCGRVAGSQDLHCQAWHVLQVDLLMEKYFELWLGFKPGIISQTCTIRALFKFLMNCSLFASFGADLCHRSNT